MDLFKELMQCSKKSTKEDLLGIFIIKLKSLKLKFKYIKFILKYNKVVELLLLMVQI